MGKRVKMTFASGEWRPVKELLRRRFPYLPEATAAKLILLELSENTGQAASTVTCGASESPAVPDSHLQSPAVPTPDPTPVRAGTDPDPEKKDKSKKEPRLAPLDVCTLIISDLNSQAGSSYRPKGAAARKLIALRMGEGNTVEDFYTVHRKMAAAWKGTEWARYLRPETLYGTKFEAYLGGPEPGKAMDPGVADALRMMGVKP